MSLGKRIILIKVGSQVVTTPTKKIDTKVISHIVEQIAHLKSLGAKVVLISSGAVSFGRVHFTNVIKGSPILSRQIYASIGQVKLMEAYQKYFKRYGLYAAQILATKEDFRDKVHYLNMRSCFMGLLSDNVVPVANENDVVAIDELMFTDNDELASLVAGMVCADTAIFLSNVEGLYDRPPTEENAQLIHHIDLFQDTVSVEISTTPSTFGRGGMHTKYRMAKKLGSMGINVHIAYGKRENVIVDIIDKKTVGTSFAAKKTVSHLKKRIAAFQGSAQGRIMVNPCLEKILKAREKATSILPIGIENVLGSFEEGDIVKVTTTKNEVLGYGIAKYGSKELKPLLGQKQQKTFIHYDYLYVGG